MDKVAVFACVVLLAGAAVAAPGPGSSWRRASEAESSPDRDVEVVEPVRSGGSRGGLGGRGVIAVPAEDSDESDDRPITFGIGLRGLGGLGGLGGFGGSGGYGPVRPVIVRTLAQPGSRDAAEDSDEDMPGGYVPTGYLHPYFVDPMTEFMAQMAEMMAAMRRQMTQVMNRGGADSDEDGPAPDLSKLGNTTSTTKVVDGHVVTVNETVIGGDGDSAVLHVRVIDIHPSESPADADADAATPSSAEDADKDKEADGAATAGKGQDRDVEPLESSNEVPSGKPRRENEIPMKVGSEVDDLNG